MPCCEFHYAVYLRERENKFYIVICLKVHFIIYTFSNFAFRIYIFEFLHSNVDIDKAKV